MYIHSCSNIGAQGLAPNITLEYSTNTQCKTGLVAHYNCLVDATYYRKNPSKIKSQFIVSQKITRLQKIEQGRNSLFSLNHFNRLYSKVYLSACAYIFLSVILMI